MSWRWQRCGDGRFDLTADAGDCEPYGERGRALIEAAPDLLAACEAAVDKMQDDEWQINGEWGYGKPFHESDELKALRAAVAKAKGTT